VDAEAFLAEMLVIYPILGVNAETEDGFVVFTGARARAAPVGSMPGWAMNLRQGLVEAQRLVPVDGGASLQLTQEHLFGSPTAAAAVLLGRSASGPLEWKDASGTTLKALREQAVAGQETTTA
jgi:Domain of unknown function (DUF4357)